MKLNRKLFLSNLLMAIIFFVVAIKHASELLSIDVVFDASNLIVDLIFGLSMVVFIVVIAILMFYLPMLVIIQLELRLTYYFPPLAFLINKPPLPQNSIFTSYKQIYLHLQVIRC